jgi:carbon-monoxide dehydrogenase small subunit
MNQIRITLNGESVAGTVEGRTSIADFVRDARNLTGTHLACEHGVCGACTILVDGEPIRGCITLAAAVDGRRVDTIEGFEQDPLMRVIRASFSAAHGLQCGFCTPGMLLMARDIILRQSAAEPEEIRQELSGNICRCTGYAGIVQAVQLAIEQAKGMPGATAADQPGTTARLA